MSTRVRFSVTPAKSSIKASPGKTLVAFQGAAPANRVRGWINEFSLSTAGPSTDMPTLWIVHRYSLGLPGGISESVARFDLDGPIPSIGVFGGFSTPGEEPTYLAAGELLEKSLDVGSIFTWRSREGGLSIAHDNDLGIGFRMISSVYTGLGSGSMYWYE